MTSSAPQNKIARSEGARETVVIIGAGQAGAQCAVTLRESGFEGRIVLLGDEGQAPYQRPPLSKAFLGHGVSVERLYVHPMSCYDMHDVELRLHTKVDSIERNRHLLRLQNGDTIAYDKLVIATGSRPRVLELPGGRTSDVHYLRTIQDALRLRSKIQRGRRIVIVGGGYVGLEVAAIASAAGAHVTVLEAQDRVLGRVTSECVSNFFVDAHRKHGVEVHCGVEVLGFEAGERLERIICRHANVKADLAVVGVGAQPNIELARDTGLICDDGIVVDEYCRTSDPNIFAAGDNTNHWNPTMKRRVRLESVQNAVDQAAAAARNVAGDVCRYACVPWFWSAQYEYKLQTAGCFFGYDEIEERGDRTAGRFALVYRKNGLLLGVDAVNCPREYMSVRDALSKQLSHEAPRREHSIHVSQQQAA